MEDTVRKLAWDILRKNIVVDDDVMKEKRTFEVLSSEVGYTRYKDILSQCYGFYKPYNHIL